MARQQQQQQQQEQCPSPAGRLLTARPVLMLQSPTEHLQPILQYLLSDLGFTPAQTDRLLRDNAVLCGPEGPARLQLVVSFLAGKGLSREEVRHVLAQVPRVSWACWAVPCRLRGRFCKLTFPCLSMGSGLAAEVLL